MLDIINILNGNDPEAEVIYTDFNFEPDEDCSLNSDLAPVGQCQHVVLIPEHEMEKCLHFVVVRCQVVPSTRNGSDDHSDLNFLFEDITKHFIFSLAPSRANKR